MIPCGHNHGFTELEFEGLAFGALSSTEPEEEVIIILFLVLIAVIKGNQIGEHKGRERSGRGIQEAVCANSSISRSKSTRAVASHTNKGRTVKTDTLQE